MYFKKLELIGFKSFADKVVINFEPGVTAVVGPNGCGKSNVSDAIRWVLGEQSAKSLRGSSMEDVIFNGTQAKDPQNLAEVSLTLSNESKILPIDYDEVTITRRLFRSGESEYLLNKNIVRLKDIHELLMGTGIGTESYSIIEQGKMDLILNSKPEDRRVIFEEAAGITKFKSKKKEALRKLEQTDTNLLRINDIISEVKRSIGSIERQAKKAEHYKVEFEKLKNLELGVAKHEFLVFENERKNKEENLFALKAQEEEYQTLVRQVEENYFSQKKELNGLEDRLKESQAKEFQTDADMRRDQDRALLNRERIGELCERKANLCQQMALSKKRVEQFSREFESLNQEFEQIRKEEEEGLAFLASIEDAFKNLENALGALLSEQDLSKARLFELANQKAHTQTNLAKIHAEKSHLGTRLDRLRERQNSFADQARRAQEEFSVALNDFQSRQEALTRKSDERVQREKQLNELTLKIKENKEFLEKLRLDEITFRSKSDFLKEIKGKYEGFLGGVKALLKEKENNGPMALGIAGLLADLLNVESGYEMAAEASLEAYLQAVVFSADEDLLKAAEFLRREKKGRALLVSLQFQNNAAWTSVDSALAEPMLKFITCEPAVKELVEKLLKNVFFVKDSQEAYRLARSYTGAVFVTKEGERFEGQIVMGGAFSSEADSALVGRESRIRDFEVQLNSVCSQIAENENRIKEGEGQMTRLSLEGKNLDEEILSIQVGLADEKAGLAHKEEKKKKIEEELAILALEISQIDEDIKNIDREEKVLSDSGQSLLEEEANLYQRLSESENAVKERAKEKEALIVRLTEVRSKQGNCTAKREKIEKDKNWVLESKTNEEAQSGLFEKDMAAAEEKKDALECENLSLENDLKDLSIARDELLRQIEGMRLEREGLLIRLEDLEKEKTQKEHFLKEAADKAHAFELAQAQLHYEIDRLKERILNAYQVDLLVQATILETQTEAGAMLGAGADETLDIEKTKSEIQALKDKLQKIGPVNLVAIQEYEEMKTRFDFLTQQEQDLVKAKDDLHKAILKINRTTRELFTETFAKIQKHFTEYYRMLFGGGTAELVLADEEDVLESGIEIVARPPGKKLQNITLLSGGEKALTAVALMFSLFKVKPSPFCVLDEIDAPLDEANVERFCNVLRDFITTSQFIIITHNKRTMNLADILYGITMAENGVSKVVSVRFSEKVAREEEKKLRESVAEALTT